VIWVIDELFLCRFFGQSALLFMRPCHQMGWVISCNGKEFFGLRSARQIRPQETFALTAGGGLLVFTFLLKA